MGEVMVMMTGGSVTHGVVKSCCIASPLPPSLPAHIANLGIQGSQYLMRRNETNRRPVKVWCDGVTSNQILKSTGQKAMEAAGGREGSGGRRGSTSK